MRKTFLTLLVVTLVVSALPVLAATVATPPAIYLPAGGKVVTEINLSDNDVLGIVKQSIPQLSTLLKELAPDLESEFGDNLAGAINLDEFSQAIAGVHDIRLIVARYSEPIKPDEFIEQFSAGVLKAGQFSKIVSDYGFAPGAIGIYAAPGNAGIMGFVYDPDHRTAYAMRMVGGVDLPKLIHWASGIAKIATGNQPKIDQNAPAPPASAPAPEAPVESK